MDFEEAACEGSKGSEKHVVENWGKGDPSYIKAGNLATLLPLVVWKVGDVPNELCSLDTEISKQNVESANRFLLAACSKTRAESCVSSC